MTQFCKIQTLGVTWKNHEPESIWEDVYVNPKQVASIEPIIENTYVKSVIFMANGKEYRVAESLETIVTALS